MNLEPVVYVDCRYTADDASENNSEPVGDSTTNLLEASKAVGKKSDGKSCHRTETAYMEVLGVYDA